MQSNICGNGLPRVRCLSVRALNVRSLRVAISNIQNNSYEFVPIELLFSEHLDYHGNI